MNLWHFIQFVIPWYLQVALIAVAVAAVFIALVQVFGWEKVRPFFMPAIAALAAVGLLSRARQQGYKAREDEDERIADDMVQRAEEAREAVRREPPERLREDDGFRRKD